MSNTLDEITHYYRVCNTCGYGWWGLHCPHDGYQNNCGNCNTRPTIPPGDLCKCEFVADVEQIQALITEEYKRGWQNAWKVINTQSKEQLKEKL